MSNEMKKAVHLAVSFVVALIVPVSDAAAIPPPDFVVNAGMQLAQAIGVAAFFCSAAFAYVFHRFKSFFNSPWRRRAGWSMLVVGVGVVVTAALWSF